MSVEQAIASVASHLVMVKDGQGRIYHPQYGINTIGNMEPGQGYEVFVDQAATLTFPANTVTQPLGKGGSVKEARLSAPVGRSMGQAAEQ